MERFHYHGDMSNPIFPKNLHGIKFHLVGIKGTGVCAMAELLTLEGATVSGSDVAESFYTDTVLASLHIVPRLFNSDNIRGDIDFVIYSAAYNPDSHIEICEAKKLNIPVYSYPQALGAFSALKPSFAICGVHGKTTTTAIAGAIAMAVRIPATILAGSAVKAFGDKSTVSVGSKYFIAETCEYRRHFMEFSPAKLILTSIEPDHQDYFPDYNSIQSAFIDFMLKLPKNGTVIYCADDGGASETVALVLDSRPDIRAIPYGFSAQGKYRIESYAVSDEHSTFKLEEFPELFSVQVPGSHVVLDACAAIALTVQILEDEHGRPANGMEKKQIRQGLKDFTGSRRRAEIIGNAGGILFMDDYAHHPTAIRTTLSGLKQFYPRRRLIVDFMAHTYSRTSALFDDFAHAFSDADHVVMHKIYPSAREKTNTEISGSLLCQAASNCGIKAEYFEEPMDAKNWLAAFLKPSDLFITLGAGDNWKLCHELFSVFKTMEKETR